MTAITGKETLLLSSIRQRLLDLGFIFAYITANIYHYFEYPNYNYTLPAFGIALVSIFYLAISSNTDLKKFRPKSFLKKTDLIYSLFFVLVLYLIGLHYLEWPKGANHTNFNSFILFLILGFYIKGFLKHKKLTLDLTTNSVFLLLALIILYLITGLHKMNYDFYNPMSSCANWFHEKLAQRLILEGSYKDLPLWFLRVSPYVVGCIELLGPLLLLFYKTRFYGVVLMLILHLYLALGGFSDFSALCISILILFFNINQKNIKMWYIRTQWVLFSTSIVLVLCYLPRFLNFINISTLGYESSFQALQGVVLILTTLLLLNSHGTYPTKIKILDFKTYKFEILILMLLLIFGLLPYLGYRTAGTFTMFSNLKIIGNHNNHFFMPKLSVFNNDTEIFQIADTSHPDLFLEDRRKNDWISKTALEFAVSRGKSLLSKEPFYLKLKDKKGEFIELDSQSVSAFLNFNHHWMFYKTYMYNYIPGNKSKNTCKW